MFLLFLIGLGTADVNAQVRIGGNAAPNGAAVLDLNATDAATGTKGLALPRVRLDSTTVQITPGVANLNGMLVYNTTATLGAGIYFWNGSTWVRTNLPATSASDSGKLLVSNGTTWVASGLNQGSLNMPDSLVGWRHDSITWTKVFDTLLPAFTRYNNIMLVWKTTGLTAWDVCTSNQPGLRVVLTTTNQLRGYNMNGGTIMGQTDLATRIRCYRPSM